MDTKLNFVLDKINKAGIEVITDEKEYNRIKNYLKENKIKTQYMKLDWVQEKEIDYGSINNPRDMIPLLSNYAKSPQEIFTVTTLDGSHSPIRTKIISVGSVNKALVHPREVFRDAILDNAASIILSHNHPSGDTEPSNEDIITTDTLIKASKIIGIQILDHIIVSENNYFSFMEHDLMNEQEQNMKAQGIIYGFTYNNKIYLDPLLLDSNVSIHEYTHLWDKYTEKTNPELWNKGKELFKKTYLWNEVINNPDYQDIIHDENLILSECHAQISGKIADKILDKIIDENGTDITNAVIDWDKEVFEYCKKEFNINNKDLSQFITSTMKDFMNETKITEYINSQNKENNMTEKEKTLNAIESLNDYYKGKIEIAKEMAQKNIDAQQKERYKIENVLPYSFNPEDNYLYACVAYDKKTDKYVTWNSLNIDNNGSLNFGHYDLSEDNAYEILNNYVKKEIFDNSKIKENNNKREITMGNANIYTFSPFGYEGSLVTVESDVRKGLPAVDIVGLADGLVKESRERMITAFKNTNTNFPSERVLISLSPADLRKDNPMDLAMAVSILNQTNNFSKENILVLGELELNGEVRPVKGNEAAVRDAKAKGITNIVCNSVTKNIIENIEGINICTIDNLSEVTKKLSDIKNFIPTQIQNNKKDNSVTFNNEYFSSEDKLNSMIKGNYQTIRALEIAAAGKHNIINVGEPGCGKTLLTLNILPVITPKLTEEESITKNRIWSLCGLEKPNDKYKNIAPFRMPHQTCSIEGMCGGGPNCRAGEISLSHNGTLFLDEGAEFRSSVLQMLRVPLENQSITLCRAGRSTTYPADFQLAINVNPTPSGIWPDSKNKPCLDGTHSIEMYWKKFSDPLLDRIEIKNKVIKDENDTRTTTITQMRNEITDAYKIQRERGIYNSRLSAMDIDKYCKLEKKDDEYFKKQIEKNNFTPRQINNTLKVALTIANMDGRKNIQTNDLKESISLIQNVFEKTNEYKHEPSNLITTENVKNDLITVFSNGKIPEYYNDTEKEKLNKLQKEWEKLPCDDDGPSKIQEAEMNEFIECSASTISHEHNRNNPFQNDVDAILSKIKETHAIGDNLVNHIYHNNKDFYDQLDNRYGGTDLDKFVNKVYEDNKKLEKLEKQNNFIENSNKTFQENYSETNPLNAAQKLNEKLTDKLTIEQTNQIIDKTKDLSSKLSNNINQKENIENKSNKKGRK